MKFFLAFAVLVLVMAFLRPAPGAILFLVVMPILAVWFWRDTRQNRGDAAPGSASSERHDLIGRLRASLYQFLK
ncbi:MAG: hypothetical protein JSR60_08750 [Proteobacteria bacterium]|nr:hypothetical protein [Pseudomonadota bacterium]